MAASSQQHHKHHRHHHRHRPYVSLAFRTLAFVGNLFALAYCFFFVLTPAHFTGSLRHLTHVSHILQTLYYGLAVIFLLFGFSGHLSKPLEYLFFLIFTISSLVGVLFWAIFFIDRSLILPPEFDAIYPWQLSLFQHGGAAIIVWLDFFVCFAPESKLVKEHGVAIALTFGVLYTLWVVITALFNNWDWPYPFMNQMPAWGLIIFFPAMLFVQLIFSHFAIKLFEWRHSTVNQKQKQ